MSFAKIWGCLYLLGLVGHLFAVSVTWSAIFLGLFKVMCYFPHGKSTIWGIYSENFLFFGDHLSKSKFVPGNRMQMLSVSHSSAGGFFRMKAMRWIRSFKFCHFHFPQYLANEHQMALLESWIPRLIITFPLKLIFVGDFEGKHFQTHPNDPLNTRLLGPNSTAHRNSELLRNAAQRRSAQVHCSRRFVPSGANPSLTGDDSQPSGEIDQWMVPVNLIHLSRGAPSYISILGLVLWLQSDQV